MLSLFKEKLEKVEQTEEETEQGRKNQLHFFLADIVVVINKLNSVIRFDLDEVVINNILQIECKAKVFEIYGRILTTYKQLTVKEFKHLCL